MDEKEQALAALAEVIAGREDFELREVQAVAKARAAKNSWGAIGEVYKVTRQASHARWANKIGEQ